MSADLSYSESGEYTWAASGVSQLFAHTKAVLKEGEFRVLQSPQFTLCGFRWTLALGLQLDAFSGSCMLGLVLQIVDPVCSVKTEWTVTGGGTQLAKVDTFHSLRISSAVFLFTAAQTQAMINSPSISPYIKNDSLVISLHLKTTRAVKPSRSEQAYQLLSWLGENSTMRDFKLISTDDAEFNVHKVTSL